MNSTSLVCHSHLTLGEWVRAVHLKTGSEDNKEWPQTDRLKPHVFFWSCPQGLTNSERHITMRAIKTHNISIPYLPPTPNPFMLPTFVVNPLAPPPQQPLRCILHTLDK